MNKLANPLTGPKAEILPLFILLHLYKEENYLIMLKYAKIDLKYKVKI
jgi:hypothetical protein